MDFIVLSCTSDYNDAIDTEHRQAEQNIAPLVNDFLKDVIV